jgi:hypothetical protein
MITWNSELHMKINYCKTSDRELKSKISELHIAVNSRLTTKSTFTMDITIPAGVDSISVDPRWLKEACEKAIKIGEI